MYSFLILIVIEKGINKISDQIVINKKVPLRLSPLGLKEPTFAQSANYEVQHNCSLSSANPANVILHSQIFFIPIQIIYYGKC